MALSKIDPAGLDIGQIGGRRNLIINGAMQVAQRGTSSTTAGFGTVDRWQVIGNTGSITQTQEALSSGDPYDAGFRNFVRITNTDVVTNSTSAYRIIPTLLEAQDLSNSGWNHTSSSSYVTLSFWVRSSVAQTYYAFVRTFDGTGSNYVIPFTLSANTWTKVTEAIPGNSAVQFDNDNGQGLQVLVAPYWGTDFTDSGVATNQWRTFSGSARTPDMTSTWADTDEATFDLTGVQLEVGSVSTPYEHRSFGDELALCQRYYQQFGRSSSDAGALMGMVRNTHFTSGFSFPVTMRSAPTGVAYGSNSTSGVIQIVFGTTTDTDHTANSSDVRVELLSTDYGRFRILSTSGPNGEGAYVDLGTGNNQVGITLDAEL